MLFHGGIFANCFAFLIGVGLLRFSVCVDVLQYCNPFGV